MKKHFRLIAKKTYLIITSSLAINAALTACFIIATFYFSLRLLVPACIFLLIFLVNIIIAIVVFQDRITVINNIVNLHNENINRFHVNEIDRIELHDDNRFHHNSKKRTTGMQILFILKNGRKKRIFVDDLSKKKYNKIVDYFLEKQNIK